MSVRCAHGVWSKRNIYNPAAPACRPKRFENASRYSVKTAVCCRGDSKQQFSLSRWSAGSVRNDHMPSLQDYSMVRLHPRVAGGFAVALWLLGTAQCFLAPPLARGVKGNTGASRITNSRSRLSSSTCVRQSIRGGFSVPAYYPLLIFSLSWVLGKSHPFGKKLFGIKWHCCCPRRSLFQPNA